MSLADRYRAHRADVRTRKAVLRAIRNAGAATVQQELIAIAQTRPRRKPGRGVI